jgi:polysaccharide biosynthesis/export protein
MSGLKTATMAALAALAAASAAPVGAIAAPAPTPAALPAPAQADEGDYRIGTNDLLEIEVFEVQDLNREVKVDGEGRIRLPLVGEVQAQGKTPTQLSEDLKVALEAKYLNQARVSVQVKQSQSRQVTVDGAVTQPGVYPMTGSTTLLQAVAMAKGPDGANANVHKVSLFHNVDSKWTRTEYDLSKIRSGAIDDPVVHGRDVIVVANSKKQTVLTTLGSILPVIMLAAAL